MPDFRSTLRGFRRQPLFSAAVVLTLALGLGAATALFTVVDAVLLRPLPLPRPERLIHLWQSNFDQGLPRFAVSPPDYLDFAERAHSFTGLAAQHAADMSLSGDGEPARLLGARVSSSYFGVLEVPMVLGRSFAEGEGQPGQPATMILSEPLWRSRFGADPSLLGRSLRLDGVPRTVIGVAAANAYLEKEVWIPLVLENVAEERGAHYFSVIGRLAPGVELAEARRELQALAEQLEREHPDLNAGWSADLEPLQELLVADLRPALYTLLAAVAALLLIACSNVAHLLMVRLASRQREMALRSALGASPGRIVGQLLLESTLLALAGGALGLVIATWGTRTLLAIDPDTLPRAAEIGVDGRVLLFGLGLSLLTSLIFGLVPALRSARPNLVETLQEGGRGQAAGGDWLRRSLVLGEVALAVALVAAGGLVLRSLSHLSSMPSGFEPAQVLVAEVAPARADYPSPEEARQFLRRLYDRLGVGPAADAGSSPLPGVDVIATVEPLPFTGRAMVLGLAIAGRPPAPPGQDPIARARIVSPGYFRALGLPLIAGRDFDARDDERAAPTVIVSQAAAARFWPDGSAIGERITFDDPGDPQASWRTVVGVAADTRSEDLGGTAEPLLYLPSLQLPALRSSLLLRISGSPAGAVEALRSALREVDPQTPLYDLRTMEQVLASRLAQPRFNASLLGLFALLALVLAAIGVYGVTSYWVSQRRREIGIRAALGADRGTLLRWVVSLGMAPVLLGVGLGAVLAWLAGRLLRGLVYGVGVHDPVILAGSGAALAAVAALACWLPARRAARIDPGQALRED